MVPGFKLLSAFGVLYNFFILYVHMPDLEKKYSTAYIIFETLIQAFTANVVFALVGYLLEYYQVVESGYGMGMGAVSFAFVWKKAALNPE